MTKRMLLSALVAMFALFGVAACDTGDGPNDPGQDDVLVPDTQPDEFRPTTFEFLQITPTELTVHITITDTTGRVMEDEDGVLLDRVPVQGAATFVVYHPEQANGYTTYARIETEYPIQFHATKTWYNKYDSVFTRDYSYSTTGMEIVVTGPTEDKCESIRASGLCRTWQGFEINGDGSYRNRVQVTCDNSMDAEHPDTCAVTIETDNFILARVTLYGTEVPTSEYQLEKKTSVKTVLLWLEDDLNILNYFVDYNDDDSSSLLRAH